MNEDVGKKWIKQALHDLEMAEKNVAIKGYDIAAFLAHQSVEKLLKSIYAFEGKKIPKIHYIDELGKGLKIDKNILDEVIDLTSDYIFSRYPDVGDQVPFEEYTENMAIIRVNKAKKIFKALKERYKDEEIENNG